MRPSLGGSRYSALQRGEEFVHAFQATVEFRHRRRVRDADVLLGAEAFSWNGSDVRLTQQLAGEFAE